MEMEIFTPHVDRRYAKYIFLDVVQFSNRSAEAQSEIVQQLNEIVRQALSSAKVNQDEDCILLPTGDGMCIAFIGINTPYDAHIQLGLTILSLLRLYNEQVQNETRRFQVRIGINQNTDILVTDINGRRNLAGAGINMAARIMDQADGGQILVGQAVYHELAPSESYMNKFKTFAAIAKHDVHLEVHQYVAGGHVGLNIEEPSAFAISLPAETGLTEQAGHYFAQAILHRGDLLTIRANGESYLNCAAIVLLRLLADDQYRLSKSGGFENPPGKHTVGAGTWSFQRQYEYYKSQDFWVLSDAEAFIKCEGDGFCLSQYRECFETGGFLVHFEFLNARGSRKLMEEWPSIWKRYELDGYAQSS